MDHKNHHSSTDSSFSNSATIKDHNLRQLNKNSHNISKPIIKKPTFDTSQNPTFSKNTFPDSQPRAHVYNISKTDFRDMVQKLTGSPSHQPKPVSSSRLHRLRPPPLPQIFSHRPPLHAAVRPPSPLPPFPSVHAESPVSVYMRFLCNSTVSSSCSESEFQMPSSPISFGVPLSPTVPVTSTGWENL